MRKFRELDIWTMGMAVVKSTYLVAKMMPKEEIFVLTSQMKRAAISIPSNIAEGCSRNSNKEFIRFLEIAVGSSFELQTQLLIGQDLEFLNGEDVDNLIDKLDHLQAKINAFMVSVKKFQ